MTEVEADIWVLTETFIDRSPGDDFEGCHSPHHPERRPDSRERWTSIWSRWPLTPLTNPPPHRRGSVTAMIETPLGDLIVYGTVIAWGNEPTFADGSPALAWGVHIAEIERQSKEWMAIRNNHPDIPLIVTGDLNQGRSGRKWDDGTKAARRALTDGLDAAGLACVTEVDLVVTGQIERSHVEHICLDPRLATSGDVLVWDRINDDGTRLSDHPTLAVDIAIR